jgi:GSH-dependent disulfide-bond oxidoreductase|tara:strand:+ start:788 stop:1450 length:663 start_codon:yes stop_codon:yes gene_type:complete
MIDLYTSPTPNGWKVAMMLEELDLDYTVKYVDLAAGDQQKPNFLTMNPNGRIPVIVDQDADGQTIFDSNAILFYLAEKTGKLLPQEGQDRHEVMQWLMFQASGIGPMQGQAVAFERYFPSDVPAAKARYHNETRRLYEVLNTHLIKRTWLTKAFSIADISNWSWIRSHRWARVPTDGLTELERWMDQMRGRPACDRGLSIPPSPGRADAVKALGSAMTTA